MRKLILFDMDGTLLNSEKCIRPESIEAIREAVGQGMEAAFGTGRCLSELLLYKELYPLIRYGVCESGGLIYDFREQKILHRTCFDVDLAKKVLEASRMEELLLQFESGGQGYVSADDVPNMAHFGLADYRPLYEETAEKVEDIRGTLLSRIDQIEKINLYHAKAEGRARTRARIEDLPLALADSDAYGLEVSPRGVTKGAGLETLCSILGISLEECAAVGDADNDLTMLRAAGLSIAMGNAIDEAKAAADLIVSDNDHDGIVEAVRAAMA